MLLAITRARALDGRSSSSQYFFTIFYLKSFNNAGFGLFTLQGRSLWPSAPRMAKRWKREHLSTCRGLAQDRPLYYDNILQMVV